MQHDRRDHDSKAERDHAVGILDAGVDQKRPEKTRDGDGDDTARCDPGCQDAFLNGGARADGRDHYRDRPDDEKQRQDEEKRLQVQSQNVVEGQRGGKQDEEAGDEQGGDRLLEPAHVGQRGNPCIRNEDTHDRDGQKTCFLKCHIGHRVDTDNDREEDGRLEIFRHMAADEGPFDQSSADEAQDDRSTAAENKFKCDLACVMVGNDHEHGFEGDHRAERADWIVDDGLPSEKRCGPRAELGLPQQWHDHGRAGHDQDGAENHRRRPAQAADVVRGQRCTEPGQRAGDHDDALDGARGFANFAQIERQPAFKQDHRHRDRDDRAVDVAEILGRIEKAGHRAGKKTGGKQQYDGREVKPPREPLCGHAGGADKGDL